MKTELQVGHLHLPDIVPGDATKLIVLPFRGLDVRGQILKLRQIKVQGALSGLRLSS